MRRLYLDSCVLIYRVQGVEPWNLRVAEALDSVGEARIVVTELTRMECRTGPMSDNDQQTLTLFDRFFVRSDVERVALSKGVFELATKLRARYRLKTPDALHLAAALTARCDELWTNDNRLQKATTGLLAIRAFSDTDTTNGV